MHDTPTSRLLVAPAGSWVRWIDQLVPFHRSANVRWVPARLIEDPTAVHDLDDAQDTPRRLLSVTPAGFGVGWIDQLLPFQRSASVASAPNALVMNPTAVHNLWVHDTPSSSLFTPGGIGVRCTAQAEAAAPVAAAGQRAA